MRRSPMLPLACPERDRNPRPVPVSSPCSAKLIAPCSASSTRMSRGLSASYRFVAAAIAFVRAMSPGMCRSAALAFERAAAPNSNRAPLPSRNTFICSTLIGRKPTGPCCAFRNTTPGLPSAIAGTSSRALAGESMMRPSVPTFVNRRSVILIDCVRAPAGMLKARPTSKPSASSSAARVPAMTTCPATSMPVPGPKASDKLRVRVASALLGSALPEG